MKIVTDSATDTELLQESEINIPVVPLRVKLGNEEFKDKIDLMVYKLYELTYKEVKIVDTEFDKVLSEFGLSKSDYERMSVEELAEI